MLSAINAGNTGTNRPRQAEISTAGWHTFAGRVTRPKFQPSVGILLRGGSPEGIIYVLLERVGGGGFLVAVGPDGTEKLHSPRLANVYTSGGFSVAFGPGVAVYAVGGTLHALEPNGAQKWKFDFDGKGSSRLVRPHPRR